MEGEDAAMGDLEGEEEEFLERDFDCDEGNSRFEHTPSWSSVGSASWSS